MVWGPEAPTKKHGSHQSALKEAHRLSKKFPGVEFAIVEIKKLIVHHELAELEQPAEQTTPVAPAKPTRRKRDTAGPLSGFIG